jgi:hypothetical protein
MQYAFPYCSSFRRSTSTAPLATAIGIGNFANEMSALNVGERWTAAL